MDDLPTRDRPVALIIGAGPGVSGSFARLLADEGWDLALLGVADDVLAELAADGHTRGARVETTSADVTDVEAARAAITGLAAAFGAVHLVHFNPSAYREADPLALSVPGLLEDVALGVGGLLTAIQAARPFMGPGGRVTATGSMAADQPDPAAASLGVQKAGLRNLVRSLDASLRDEGIRAVSVTVRGALAAEGAFTPDRVAEALWAAMRQDEDSWSSEVAYTG